MAEADYAEKETAVLNRLVAHFASELSATRCKAGDLDAVMDAIFTEGADYGCVLEFDGGREQAGAPFKHSVWVWLIVGIFFIRYSDDIEQKLRTVISKLANMFEDDHTLGGVTPLVKVSEINAAEPGQVNDVPFYWLPFVVEIIDR